MAVTNFENAQLNLVIISESGEATSAFLRQAGSDPGGGTPGGSDTQVQFNDADAFGGDGGLTYNKTNKTLAFKASVGGAGNVFDLFDSDSGNRGGLYIDESPFVELLLNGTSRAVQLIASSTDAKVVALSGAATAILDGVAGSVSASNLFALTPTADPPGSPTEGMIYADTDHHLYYYNGTIWKTLDNA